MKMLKAVLPTVVAVVFAVGVSHADFFYRWSTTANTNANSDTFTWAEGQAPSTVNDSARGMMAALAKWRDDTSGKLVTAGGPTSFTIATNQVFSSLALMDGARLSFRMNATAAANPTLNVDGLGARALNSATGVAATASALVIGAVYSAVYVNASNEWIVAGLTGLVASGTSIVSVATACPAGFTLSAAYNDRLPVFQSSGGGLAGSVGFSGVFSGGNVTGSHVLTAAELAQHTHGWGTLGDNGRFGTYTNSVSGYSLDHTHPFDDRGFAASNQTAAGGNPPGGSQNSTPSGTGFASTAGYTLDHAHLIDVGGNTNAGNGIFNAGHNHTIPAVASVGVILCIKN